MYFVASMTDRARSAKSVIVLLRQVGGQAFFQVGPGASRSTTR